MRQTSRLTGPINSDAAAAVFFVRNFPTGFDDLLLMECHHASEIISAMLDNEATGQEVVGLEEHLGGCADCRLRADGYGRIHRSVHIRVASPVPDLMPIIMSRSNTPRVGRWEWIRYSLGVIAATNLVVGLIEFLDLGNTGGHQSRHLGAFTIAMSIGLLFAAVRPERSYGLLPFVGALGFMMVLGAALDMAQEGESLFDESTHALDLLGLVLLWLLADGPKLSVIPSKLGYIRSPSIHS